MTPYPQCHVPLAGLVPSLHEIVMHVGGGRARDLDIDVVTLPLTHVSRFNDCKSWIDPADKSRLRRPPSVDQPAFLMMTIGERSSVPSCKKTRAACGKQIEVRARAGERLPVSAALGVGPPEHHTDVHASFDRTVQDIED